MEEDNVFANFEADEIIEDDSLPDRLMVLDLPDYNKEIVLKDTKAIVYDSYESAYDQLKTDTDFICQMNCKNGSFFWIVDLSEILKKETN